jgi:hypothetical protein
MGKCQNSSTCESIASYQFFVRQYLAGYKQWIHRLNKLIVNKLTDLAGRLARTAALKVLATILKRLHVVDSFPIPACEPI